MTVKNTTLSTKVGLLISYYITLSFWSAQTLCLSMVSRNIAGQTKKATVVAATFISWATGNAIGTSCFHFPPNLPLLIIPPKARKSSWTGTHPAITLPGACTWRATPA